MGVKRGGGFPARNLPLGVGVGSMLAYCNVPGFFFFFFFFGQKGI